MFSVHQKFILSVCRSVYFSDSVVKLHTFGELTPDYGTEQTGVTVLY